MYIVGIILYYL